MKTTSCYVRDHSPLRRAFVLAIVFLAFSAVSVVPIIAQTRTGPVNAENGVAIHGYDPVAYHTEGAAIRGDEAFSYDWNGATWWFQDEVSKDAFVADPDRYAPAYGGYCAWAMSNDSIAGIDPERWTIEDGKLYLNYSRWTKLRFDTDIDDRVEAADQYWQRRQ